MSDESDLSLPKEVVNNLTEFSPGGFILFILNDKGSPEIFHFYDSDMAALALQSFALLWTQATHESQSDTMFKMMSASLRPPSDEEISEEE